MGEHRTNPAIFVGLTIGKITDRGDGLIRIYNQAGGCMFKVPRDQLYDVEGKLPDLSKLPAA